MSVVRVERFVEMILDAVNVKCPFFIKKKETEILKQNMKTHVSVRAMLNLG